MPALMCKSEDDNVLHVMCMEMLSVLHWLGERVTLVGPTQGLVDVSKPSYVLTNTMVSLDLR